jgi:hypothetical protein
LFYIGAHDPSSQMQHADHYLHSQNLKTTVNNITEVDTTCINFYFTYI